MKKSLFGAACLRSMRRVRMRYWIHFHTYVLDTLPHVLDTRVVSGGACLRSMRRVRMRNAAEDASSRRPGPPSEPDRPAS